MFCLILISTGNYYTLILQNEIHFFFLWGSVKKLCLKKIGKIRKRAFKECLPGILKEAANAASLSLNNKVWTGRIVSLNTKEIIINAGSDVGLRAGVVLEVFSKGEYITSFNEQTY